MAAFPRDTSRQRQPLLPPGEGWDERIRIKFFLIYPLTLTLSQ